MSFRVCNWDSIKNMKQMVFIGFTTARKRNKKKRENLWLKNYVNFSIWKGEGRKGQCYPLSIHVEKKTNCDHKMNIEQNRTLQPTSKTLSTQPTLFYYPTWMISLLILSWPDDCNFNKLMYYSTSQFNVHPFWLLWYWYGLVFVPSKQDNMERRRGKKDITNKFIHLEDWIKFAFRNSLSSF